MLVMCGFVYPMARRWYHILRRCQLQEHEHWFILSDDPISRAQVMMAGAITRLHAVKCISIPRLERVEDIDSDD